jgi:uncharacterized protein (DUF2384 family)
MRSSGQTCNTAEPSPAETLRKEQGRSASIAMAGYQQIIARAVETFGDELTASRWLSLPSVDFGGHTPLEIAQRNAYDLQSIEPVLTRIEHGINL